MDTIDAKGIPLDSKYGKINSIKIRRTWEINPKTRIKENKKKYNRRKEKQKFKKQMEEE